MAIDEELREKFAEAMDLGVEAIELGCREPTPKEMAEGMVQQLERVEGVTGQRVTPEYLRYMARKQHELGDELERIAAEREGH